MLAHIREQDGKKQQLGIHCRNVAELCSIADAAQSFRSLAYLTGLLHDMGKASAAFQEYLHWAVAHPGEKKEHQNHAATGAIFAWERWKEQDGLTAQIIALCVSGHHTALQDCLNHEGSSPFLRDMTQDRSKLNYDEAVSNYLREVAEPEELDGLFKAASEEIGSCFGEPKLSFTKGMLTRLLLAILVDADRWDSVCFEFNDEPLESIAPPDWKSMLAHFDAFRKRQFTGATELDRVRAEISDGCAAKGSAEQGVYSLSVPTGGGKTFTSLRFALLHADRHHLKRIFYIIPYNTILDQNAADIQEALGETASVLVHHANVVKEDEEEEKEYRRLTERWDSEIILSSMVQFLNTMFLGRNSSARRMRQLSDAVIIFDEIQSLPKHCKALFEKAVDFLAKYCRSTVVLCSATQPKIELKQNNSELIDGVDALYRALKRIRYIPETKPELSNGEAAAKLYGMLQGGRSVLCVVNVKKTACEIYEHTTGILRESGWKLLELPDGTSEETLRKTAAACGERDILCVHLSTLVCPAHRMERLKAVKIWTKLRKPVLCVSTALIEAGINVSFPVVVRSMAGLPSVIQAGGRCNRNCEAECGDVYIWKLYEEKNSLRSLPDIQNGQSILSSMLDVNGYAEKPDELGMPEAVELYFAQEAPYSEKQSKYPYDEWHTNLVAMLANNPDCRINAKGRADKSPLELPLQQSFRTAGKAFQVISEDTQSVLVPYGAGKDLIAALNGRNGLKELSVLLRKAQAYSVSLYPNAIRRLSEEGALTEIGDTDVLALKEGWYNPDGGVQLTKQEMEDMIF